MTPTRISTRNVVKYYGKGEGKTFLKLKNIPFHSFQHESYTMHIHCHFIIPNGIRKIIQRRFCFYIPLHFMAILAFSTSLLSYITNITLIHLYIYGYSALFVSGLGRLALEYLLSEIIIFLQIKHYPWQEYHEYMKNEIKMKRQAK